MREIQFRAWDITARKMLEVIMDAGMLPWLDYPAKEKLDTGAIDSMTAFEWQDGIYKLMQYTGLKDKNGVEIYEGDIVKGPNRTVCEVKLEEVNGLIAWSGVYQGQHYSLKEVEVVGNIYESLELLK